MPQTLSGKICLVTGASKGIGRGIALQLGQAGATVYITGRMEKHNWRTVLLNLDTVILQVEAKKH